MQNTQIWAFWALRYRYRSNRYRYRLHSVGRYRYRLDQYQYRLASVRWYRYRSISVPVPLHEFAQNCFFLPLLVPILFIQLPQLYILIFPLITKRSLISLIFEINLFYFYFGILSSLIMPYMSPLINYNCTLALVP